MSRVGTDVPSEVEEPATGDPGDQPDQPVPSWTERRLLVWGGLFALVALPLLVATVALRRPPWYPALDFAMTELRLRDVGTRHTPLIGLPGRIGPRLEEQGSHPGPLSFYLLAPVYRLFGSSGWAMQVGAVTLNVAAIGSALAIAVRRGGARLGLAVAAMSVLLVAGYGPAMLTQPWNPYLPLLWWVVLLLAVWAVTCGDVAMLPLAVFAATLCSQTHVSYLGLVAVVGAVAVVGVVLAWRRTPSPSPERRTVARWSAVSLVLALVLWLPPLIDQVVHDPGNMRAIGDHLATPSEPPLGQVHAIKLVLLHLDIPAFLSRGTSWVGALPDPSVDPRGSMIPGAVVLAVWAVAWLAAVRLRHGALMRLHLVVAAGLVASVVSTSRIFGKDWYYLTLWAWGVAALAVLAVGWTAVAFVGDRAGPDHRPRLSRAVTVGLGGLVAVVSLAVAVGAVRTDPPDSRLSATLAAVLPDTLGALERGEGPATGRDGRYLVLFSDTMYFGSQAFGIVDELERKGFDVGMPELFHVPVTRHRVVDPDDATAAIVIANGKNVVRLRNIPGTLEVALVDPRHADDKAEYDRVRDALVQELERDGLDELVQHVDGNLYALAIDPRASQSALRKVSRLLELGSPTAVFLAPPDVAL